jgi:hypothetical protein
MNSDNRNMTRGNALQALAIGPLAIAVAFAAVREADATAGATKEGTIAPSAVQYQSTPKNGQQCSTCKFYINTKKSKTANGGCTQVSGPIGPKAWCAVYVKGDNSKQTM